MVWKLWREQKFKVKNWPVQKSRADNLRTQTAIKIPRPRCTTKHHGDSLWQVKKIPMETVGGVPHTRNC